MPWRSVCLAFLLVLGISGARAQQATLGCEPMGSVRPVCKFQGPEDLAALPGGKALLVSEFALLDPKRGLGISLYLPATDQVRRLFPAAEAPEAPQEGVAALRCRWQVRSESRRDQPAGRIRRGNQRQRPD